VDLYSSGQSDLAEISFLQAIELKGGNHIPFYYLGLISYDRKDYQNAYNYYITAQEFGIDPGLISYALGVNAFADGQYVLAESYLLEATEFDPETYGGKADSLLRRIEYLR
jgi:Flp pilus assembly protein TadD